ncbi:unnamed protein product [Mytilus edulis]|uniref:Reverse transcriptase domain-containing protein n=1 Tax=Mytilus edulis TaxID=6550 RepID=A0A8S3SXY9_MYTED|nr:unnamed protein product [Mytilus edulis]
MGLNLPGSRAPASYCGFTLPASASNAMSWSRPPWSQGYPFSGFPNQIFPSQFPRQPFPGFWPYCGPTPVILPQSSTSNLSVSVPAALPTSSVRHQFNQVADSGPSLDGFKSILDDFRQSISSELTCFSNRLGTLENIANNDPEDSDEEERFSVTPGSQEEDDDSVQVSQNVFQPSVPVSISSSVIGQSSTNSSKDHEAEDTPSTLKDLRDSVYTIMRDVNKVPFQSPPRPKKLTSTFEASCDHNDGIVANESQFSQVSGFGLASFTEQFRSKDYDIFDSTLGKLVSKCEKVFSSTIASKPADGLRFSQSVWSKTENLLRNASHVLGTAEHFLTAVAPVLKDSSLPPEVKPFLLQVDKALGASQLLIMGSIANCTLSKRSEILDKAEVSDNLKDDLIKSTLDEKIFGLPLDEEVARSYVTVGTQYRDVLQNSSFSIASRGRLTHFLKKWISITSDCWVLSVIRGGLTLQFKEQLPLSSVPIPLSNTQDPQKFLLLSTEVETFLTKRAVEEVPVSSIDPCFYSCIFFVSKKTGGMKPVIDLSILNSYMIIPHFKMETNRSIRASILPGMWTTSLDLTDAYFHVPVCHSYRKFLRFVWNKRVYQFRVLPFCLSTAPLAFTKLMQVAIAHLHSQAIQIHSYLDDSLMKELSPEKLYLNTDVAIRLLLSLGFSSLGKNASKLVWGAYLEGLSVSGVWTPEMKAILLALSYFQSLLQNKSLVLATENTTVVAYLRNQGGTHCYELYLLAREILLLCNHIHIQIEIRHVPGKLNVLADALSRTLTPVNTEWELLQSVFQAITLQCWLHSPSEKTR